MMVKNTVTHLIMVYSKNISVLFNLFIILIGQMRKIRIILIDANKTFDKI